VELSLSPGLVRGILRATAGLPARSGMSIAMERRWFALAEKIVRLPEGAEVRRASLGGMEAYEASGRAADPSRTVVYFHGGGYGTAAWGAYRAFIARLALGTRATVVAPDYPLAPERPFPAALDAGLASYRALAERETGPIVVAGDSAGGNLALATALALRDGGEPPPAGLVLFSPWLDLSHSGDSFERNGPREPILAHRDSRRKAAVYAAGRSLRDPRVSPLFAESLAGLPPVHLLAASDDILVSDADRFAERAREAGVKVDYHRHDGLWHDFQLFGDWLVEARSATGAACEAIAACFEASVAAGGAVETAAQR
jgi:epsilon-lactone hydrolase